MINSVLVPAGKEQQMGDTLSQQEGDPADHSDVSAALTNLSQGCPRLVRGKSGRPPKAFEELFRGIFILFQELIQDSWVEISGHVTEK